MLLYEWLLGTVKSKGGARALIYRDTYLSWRGLKHRVKRRADEFEAAGVRPGDWVGLMLGNVPDFVILSLALSKLEAAPVPLDPTTSTKDLETLMDVAPLRGLITRPRGGDAPLPSGGKKGKKRRAPVSRRRLQGTLLSCSIYEQETREVLEGDARIASVLITASSAGEPKAVERTDANLLAEAQNLTAALEITGDDKILLTLPLYHSYGYDMGLLPALLNGSAIYLEDEVAASRITKLVREQQITLLPGSIPLLEEMAKLPAARPLAHGPLRFISVGGGLTGPCLEHFRKRYGARPFSCYHTTETGTVSIDLTGKSGDTVGKVLEQVEVKVTSVKTGKNVAAGRKGLLWVRSGVVSPLEVSRIAREERQEVCKGEKDADGWFRSGYLATLDRSRRIRLQGREDDVVVLDGKRVSLGEVEACIETYEEVAKARARLFGDPLGGPMVVAEVVLKVTNEPDPEEIIDHCARNLSPFKVPRRISYVKSIE